MIKIVINPSKTELIVTSFVYSEGSMKSSKLYGADVESSVELH